MRNKRFFLVILLILLLGLAGCAAPKTDELPTFTLTELAEYDGKDGAKAYVAVDGKIYDVTDIEEWTGGAHYNGAMAGVDLSDLISKSPHGKGILNRAKLVGTLME